MQEKKFNIKVLGVSEDVFKEIMKNFLSELKTKMSLHIQRPYYVLGKLEA